MIEVIKGNIWDYHSKGHFITVTTNCNLKSNGDAVMGKGIALQAKNRFPDLPKLVGQVIKQHGHSFCAFPVERIITVPTKVNWYEESSLELIAASFAQLIIVAHTMLPDRLRPIYCVKFGCSNGHRDWETEVMPLLEPFIDPSEFVFVDTKG